MWEYLHHITLHFPIVLTMVMAVSGWAAARSEAFQGAEVGVSWLRWGGHVTLGFTTVAVWSGLMSGGFSGGEEGLAHHRYLGVLAFLVIGVAAGSYEAGIRMGSRRLRDYGRTLWWVAVVAVIGAGHWGGKWVHGDVIPW